MALQGGGAGGSTAGTAGPNVDILPSVELVLGHLSQTGTSCPLWNWRNWFWGRLGITQRFVGSSVGHHLVL